jgi:HTH-type transcriptional regulator/antitoxin HipB
VIYRRTVTTPKIPTPITSIRDVAAAVRGRRQNLGLSQADVARLAGVSRQWVSEFESGKPTAELGLVIRLLDALRLSLSIDERDASSRASLPSLSSPVDLDALLDDYREP